MSSELTALIRMHRDWLLGSTTPQGHHQCIEQPQSFDFEAFKARKRAADPDLKKASFGCE